MASLTQTAKGPKIQLVCPDGERRTIYLGKKLTKRQAETVLSYIEKLAHTVESNTIPDREVSKWLREVPDKLYKKLVTCGLATAREKIVSQTVDRLISDYVASRNGVAVATVARWTTVTNHLLAYFGKEKSLIEVTAGDADDFSEYLKSKGTADNSRRRYLGIAKQFFTWAVRHKLIAENPFADQKTTVGAGDPKRQFFLGPDLSERILETCPDLEWKLIFALMRFGGLRCPTEVLGLRWEDIIWDKARFRIYAPKTDQTRYCPIFPELLPYLRESFELAADGEEFVISKRHGMTHRGLIAQYKRILHFAAVDQYPKLFQNLRSTRQTELTRKHPAHVVCAWLGNSHKVALKHYLQVTDEDFEAAAAKVSHSPEKVSHKVPQHLQVPTRTELPRNEESPSKAEAIPDGAVRFRSVPVVRVGDTGVEPVTSTV
jgi:integrase